MDIGPILPDLSLVAYVARPLAVYLFVLTLLRLLGKREIGELTPGDLVVLLLLSEALQGAMDAGDRSLVGGMIAAAVLLFANWTVGALAARYKFVERLISSEPSVLVYQGRYLKRNMLKEHVSQDELDRQLREQGVFDIADVDIAILESDGQLSVRRAPQSADEQQPSPGTLGVQRR